MKLRSLLVLVSASVLSVVCAAQQVSHQSGVFVSQTPFTLSDKDNEQISKLDAALPAKLQTQSFSDIQYLSDGLRVTGMLAVPRGPGKYPCIILNRGGNLEFGAWTHASFAGFVGPLVDAGYVVIASQYRGNAGGEGKEEFGGADVDDVLNLIPLSWFRSAGRYQSHWNVRREPRRFDDIPHACPDGSH